MFLFLFVDLIFQSSLNLFFFFRKWGKYTNLDITREIYFEKMEIYFKITNYFRFNLLFSVKLEIRYLFFIRYQIWNFIIGKMIEIRIVS